MNKVCELRNQYRDGMLDPERQRQFESHMENCAECRTRLFLLNNLVRVIRSRELPELRQRPEQVAARAYEKSRSWDILFLTWLKPAPAWSGLALLVTLLLLLWSTPSAQQVSANSEYEVLMNESDSISAQGSTLTTLTDDELGLWLEKGGAAK
jgi:anti-sigma factor RsiW